MKVPARILLFLFYLFLSATLVSGINIDHRFRIFVTTTNSTNVTAIEVQPDGKYIIGGTFDTASGAVRFGIARFNADGTIDESFVTQAGGQVSTIIIQEDGKILLGGSTIQATYNGVTRRGAIRLNPDGSIDPTFFNGNGTSGVRAMVRQPDGKVVIAGPFNTVNGVQRVGMARFNADGSLDTGFDARPSKGWVEELEALPDGKILIGGDFALYNNQPVANLARINYDGSLDTTFPLQIPAPVTALKHLPDGKIMVAGRFDFIGNQPHKRIIRLNADGSLDTGFTSAIPTDNMFNPQAFDFDYQPDGKILVAGIFDVYTSVNFVYRLNSNGSLDSSFSLPAASGTSVAVAYHPSGHILVGGGRSGENLVGRNLFFRLHANGNIDQNFPGSVGLAASAGAMDFSPDGKIYIGGDFVEVNGKERKRIARLNPNGTLDPSFNPNAATNGLIADLAVQADGKIVIVGDFGLVNGVPYRNIARLNTDGSVDMTFQVGAGADRQVNDVAIQPDGKILIGGVFNAYNNVARYSLARINIDGSLDTSFSVGEPGLDNSVHTIVPMPDGKILIGGSFFNLNGMPKRKFTRLNSDGSLDTSFNTGGIGVSDPGSLVTAVSKIVVQADGKIIIGGTFYSINNVPRNSIARLNSDGTLDPSYVPNASKIFDMILQPDGKLVIGGNFTFINNVPQNYMTRLNTNGSLDTEFNIGVGPDNVVGGLLQTPNGNIFASGIFRKFDGRDHIGIAKIGPSSTAPVFDFDGDGKTDISIYRPSSGEWWYLRSSDTGNYAAQFGSSSDKLTPGDFTGDGITDIAIWRPSSGEWFILRSEDASYYSFPFGTTGDIPSVGDFDADGKADTAIFRPSTGTWYIRRSSDGGVIIQQFGQDGDVPVVADYDGDSRSDIAIYRAPVGEWWIQQSTAGLIAFQFGSSTDKPVQGDYTGDGQADAAIWRPSTGEWFVLRSEDQSYYSFPFGTSGDIPAPGDYDGDGKFDAAVFRPSNNIWFLNRSSAGILIQSFGQAGDMPVPSAFVR